VLTNAVLLANPLVVSEDNADSSLGMFTLEDNTAVAVVDYAARLVDDVWPDSTAIHMGFSTPAANWAWIAEEHPNGRINILDLDSMELQTVPDLRPNP